MALPIADRCPWRRALLLALSLWLVSDTDHGIQTRFPVTGRAVAECLVQGQRQRQRQVQRPQHWQW